MRGMRSEGSCNSSLGLIERNEVEMAKVKVSIVHDESGHIVSIAQPSEGSKVIILCEGGESVFETVVEENNVVELVNGNHRVDIEKNTIVKI